MARAVKHWAGFGNKLDTGTSIDWIKRCFKPPLIAAFITSATLLTTLNVGCSSVSLHVESFIFIPVSKLRFFVSDFVIFDICVNDWECSDGMLIDRT